MISGQENKLLAVSGQQSAKQAVNLCTQLGWRKGGLKADG